MVKNNHIQVTKQWENNRAFERSWACKRVEEQYNESLKSEKGWNCIDIDGCTRQIVDGN
jgi:hypothetical protein